MKPQDMLLRFLAGEIDVATFEKILYNDNGAVYVFLDEESGEIKTVKQFY